MTNTDPYDPRENAVDEADIDPRERLSRGTLIAALVGVLIAQLGLSIPAVLNGIIQEDMHPSSTQLTWVSDAFLVPVTLLELTFGVVGDLFGRKRLMVVGSSLVFVGMLLAFLTPTSGSKSTQFTYLFAGQAIGGVGAAALFPTTVAMLAAGTHSVRERSHAISMWAAALTIGGFGSPVMAALLTKVHHSGGENASWRYAFLALSLLALVSTVITFFAAKESHSPHNRALDIPGQVTVAIGVFALVFGIIQGAEGDWGSPLVIGSFVAAVVFLALFVVVERRVAKPLVQLDLFANRTFVVTAIVTVLAMFAYLGTAYATSIRISSIQGYSPLVTAGGFLALNIMGVVLFPISTTMLEKRHPGMVLTLGAALIAIGDITISLITPTNMSVWAVVVPLLVIGSGFKLAVTAITAVSVNSVPTSKAGMASGMTSMLRDFGLTLGPAVVGAIALTQASNEISSKVASNPTLKTALDAFNASPSKASGAQKAELEAAVGAVNSGPLGANGVPATVTLPNGSTHTLNPLKDTAFHALASAFSFGFLVCGISAALAAIIAGLFLARQPHTQKFVQEEAAPTA